MIPRTYTFDVIPGDGIGTEVVEAAVSCIDLVSEVAGFQIRWRHRDWGCDYYARHGQMMPNDGIRLLSDGDGIFLGAVGSPEIPDHISLWGLLLPIRREFDQYINLRPIRSLPGLPSRLSSNEPIDVVIVRENSEGEYSQIGGEFDRAGQTEFAVQETIFTRVGVERVTRYAAEIANTRRRRLISATKSNGIKHTMPFWDSTVQRILAEYPEVELESVLIDALAARAVIDPGKIDVIVASNLFGDILSDLFAGIVGSIGIAASGNINPSRSYPSMFESVHGSAPDIVGKGVANPIGQMLAGTMLLQHVREDAAARLLRLAIEAVVSEGTMTPDLGGAAATNEFTAEVRAKIVALAR